MKNRIETERADQIAKGLEEGKREAAAEAAVALRAIAEERDMLRRLEREAATYVESVICMRTNFDGEPPYVGWRGLGLALNEALDQRDKLQAELDALKASLANPLPRDTSRFKKLSSEPIAVIPENPQA